MTAAREAIYAAIFSLVSGCAAFQTTGRVLKDWSETDAQPALYQIQTGEVAHESFPGLPLRWTLNVRLFVYAQGDGSSSNTPSSALNPLIDAIEAAIAPPSGQTRQTLGGLVEHCWIEGKVEIFEGVLGNQAVAIIPVSALTRA